MILTKRYSSLRPSKQSSLPGGDALATLRRIACWFTATTHDRRQSEAAMSKSNHVHQRREKDRTRSARQQERRRLRTGLDCASTAGSPQTHAQMSTVESKSDARPIQSQRAM